MANSTIRAAVGAASDVIRCVFVAASDATADLMHGPRRLVRVVASSRRAVYLVAEPARRADPPDGSADVRDHGRVDLHADGRTPPPILSVVAHDAARQPCALQLTSSAASAMLADLDTAQSGSVGNGRLTVGGCSLRVARWWRCRPAVPLVRPDQLATGVERLGAAGAATAVTAAGLPRLCRALASGDRRTARTAAAALIGRGPGTTPDGDDGLAGLIATVSLLGPALRLRAHDVEVVRDVAEHVVTHAVGRTTDVSAGLLAHAARGEVVADVADVVTALASGFDPLPAAHRLRDLGASSGTALLHGVVAGAGLAGRLAARGMGSGRHGARPNPGCVAA